MWPCMFLPFSFDRKWAISSPGATSGSQSAVVSQYVGSRPQTRPRLASGSATPPSGSAAPVTDSATVGNYDVVEV